MFNLQHKMLILNRGLLPDMLLELARREKNAGIKPDEDLDLFMKVPLHFFFSEFDELHSGIQINPL